MPKLIALALAALAAALAALLLPPPRAVLWLARSARWGDMFGSKLCMESDMTDGESAKRDANVLICVLAVARPGGEPCAFKADKSFCMARGTLAPPLFRLFITTERLHSRRLGYRASRTVWQLTILLVPKAQYAVVQ